MPSLCVCAIFKDEEPYLDEWVAYHRIIGADHFVLYDNGSSDGGPSRLLSGDLREYVTIVPWPLRPGQQRAYEHFRVNHSERWDWVAFIDIDEFIYPAAGESVKERLDGYQGFSAVLLHWLVFGPNGHQTRPPGLVIDSYTRRLPENSAMNRHVKSIMRCNDLVDARGVHHFLVKGRSCNANGTAVPNVPIQEAACHEVMWLNHYRYKSREEWLARVAKRRADVSDAAAGSLRPVQAIDYAERDSAILDDRITRFSPRVAAMLRDGSGLDAACQPARAGKSPIEIGAAVMPHIDLRSRLETADVLLQCHMHDDAERAFRELLQAAPENSDAYAGLAILRWQQSQSEAAVDMAWRALEAGTIAPGYRAALADILAVSGELVADGGNVEEGVRRLRAAVDLNPGRGFAHTRLAELLRRRSDNVAAELALRAALERDPDSLPARRLLSQVLARQGKIDEAIVADRQAILLYADDPHLHAHLAGLLYRRAEFAEAEAALRIAIDLAPDFQPFRNSLDEIRRALGTTAASAVGGDAARIPHGFRAG